MSTMSLDLCAQRDSLFSLLSFAQKMKRFPQSAKLLWQDEAHGNFRLQNKGHRLQKHNRFAAHLNVRHHERLATDWILCFFMGAFYLGVFCSKKSAPRFHSWHVSICRFHCADSRFNLQNYYRFYDWFIFTSIENFRVFDFLFIDFRPSSRFLDCAT
jgi:hypothetical protein